MANSRIRRSAKRTARMPRKISPDEMRWNALIGEMKTARRRGDLLRAFEVQSTLVDMASTLWFGKPPPNNRTAVPHSLQERLRTRRLGLPGATPDISIDVYLANDDPNEVQKVLDAVQSLLAQAGYVVPAITDVTRGSIRARIVAWLSQDKTKEAARAKLNEGLAYAEQAAKDIVNRQRAEISSINSNTVKVLTDALAGQDSGCIRMDEFLALRYSLNGVARTQVIKLSLPELAALQRNPAIISDPSKVLENLALILYESGEDPLVLEA